MERLEEHFQTLREQGVSFFPGDDKGFDPMDEMEVPAEPTACKIRKYNSTKKRVFNKQVHTILMKECPPAEVEKEVTVYLEGLGRPWICKDDIIRLVDSDPFHPAEPRRNYHLCLMEPQYRI